MLSSLPRSTKSIVPGISITAPIRRSTPWAFIRKIFPFVPTIEMSTLFSFPSKDQLNAQGAVTESPGTVKSGGTQMRTCVYEVIGPLYE